MFGTATVARRLDYLGTARGRLGVSFGPALLYATGGLAYGRTDLAYTGMIGFPIAPTVVLSGTFSDSRTSLGYALGGGLEYAFWKNWSTPDLRLPANSSPRSKLGNTRAPPACSSSQRP